ncbi:hypothetical protein ACFYU5_18755 [Nocardia aobensis]|uniref:Uncharacterized protein n=1 Tax=Nocardia aobensis TaxID=257277 RepID=A0ABW6P5N2_9NOCA
MQLSELLDKLHDIYDRHGDLDVFTDLDFGYFEPDIEVRKNEFKTWVVL